jgi:hypothetical protein
MIEKSTQPAVHLCTHHLVDGDIHLFEFGAATRETVDALIAQLDEAVDKAQPGATFYYIVDMRESGIPPLQYFYQAGLNWVRRRDTLPKTRTVFLALPSALVTLGDTFAGIVNRAVSNEWDWKFLTDADIDDAVRWLRGR